MEGSTVPISLVSSAYDALFESGELLMEKPSSSIAQPVDSLGLAIIQSVDGGAIPATLSQSLSAFSQIANDLCMSLETLMPGRAAKAEVLPPVGHMQNITQVAANMEHLMNRHGIFVAEDPS